MKTRQEYLDYKRRYYQDHKDQWQRYQANNKPKFRAWRQKNKDRLRAKTRLWQARNREKLRAACRHYGRVNQKKLRAYRLKRLPITRKQEREKRRSNTSVRLRVNLRNRIRSAIQNDWKVTKSLSLLGCSIENFKIYIESKFEPGMSWQNYGTAWHLDHIVPCAIFDLTKPEHQKRCFHFSNHQPLFATENQRKHAKTDGQFRLI